MLLAGTLAAVFAVVAATGSISAHGLRDAIHRDGVVAPVAYVAISAALTVALFPGPVLAAASGLLFGTALGTVLSIIAATLGAALAYGVARRLGAGAVEQLAGERLLAAREWIRGRSFRSVLYARIAPLVPYTLVNYAAGLARVAFGAFVAATALGCAPRAFAYTALGGSFGDLGRPEAIVALAVLVGMAVLGLFFARREARTRTD